MYLLAITTYNRLEQLKVLIESFLQTYNPSLNWKIIIADDGSTDGTLDYLKDLKIPDMDLCLIQNNRQGIHHQFNSIIAQIKDVAFEVCFKCDDDIEFIKKGWEKLYSNAIENTKMDHLCHFDTSWRPGKNLRKPFYYNGLVSYCLSKDVQGAFFTITPEVIKKVGYMDTLEFGFRGVGHIDYTLRASRAGFNNPEHPYDVQQSNDYICHQRTSKYSSAINIHLINALENDYDSKRKYKLILDDSRVYIPFYQDAPSMNIDVEMELLYKRLNILEREKHWYEKTYGHQPQWLVRFGKLIHMIGSNIKKLL